MARLPTADDAARRPLPSEEPPDSIGYWTTRDRWLELGRRLGELRRHWGGTPLEDIPGAAPLYARFLALGKELDRHVR